MFRFNKWCKKLSLETMKKRIQYAGGDADGRNNKGKLKSMLSALQNSYQAEWITLNEYDEEKQARWRCLINPDKLKEDYDQKEISIQFESGLKEGDTFLWDRTDTHWIVYLQEYSEEAYFRAAIRRCDYQIDIGENKYWVYMRGPMETTIQWKSKHNLNANELNYTAVMFITKNQETLDFFDRFKVIKWDGHNWMVNAVDRYSQKGIIEVTLNEHFNNEMEDNMVTPEIFIPEEDVPYIEGPQIVYAFDENISYTIKNAEQGKFVVDCKEVKIINTTETSCEISILTGKSHSFNLIYERENMDNIVLEVTIESF